MAFFFVIYDMQKRIAMLMRERAVFKTGRLQYVLHSSPCKSN